MTDLSTLLARVEAGSGADRDLDEELAAAFAGATLERQNGVARFHRDGFWVPVRTPAYTTDLNAVIALVEATLPGWGYDITYRAAWGNCTAAVIGPTRDATLHVGGALTPARALLAALLRTEMETQP